MPSLFRPEVAEGRRQGWLGNIQIIRPVSLTALTVLVALSALAIGFFFSVGEYTRKARVTGYLVPDRGVMRLTSPQPAQVLERHAAEGQVVRQGDVLFVLSIERTTPQGDTHEAVLASLASRERSLQAAGKRRQQLQAAQMSALNLQRENMQRELVQMGAEANLHRQRLQLAQESLARLESLKADQFVSSAQVQAKAEDVLALRAQLQALERQQAAHRREIASLEARQHELPLSEQAELGEIERDLAELAQESAENEALRRIVVRAPQDGTVTAVGVEPGQSVGAQAALANLVPSGAALQAHLFAPSSAMGFLRTDQTVLLRYEAYPYQKFGHQVGHVMQVSRTPLPASELGGLPVSAAQEPMYRITVALDQQAVQAYGRAQALSPGMQLEADVLLDRRRLIEWIFEPVLSLTGRV
jgi:membrane fusion protein